MKFSKQNIRTIVVTLLSIVCLIVIFNNIKGLRSRYFFNNKRDIDISQPSSLHAGEYITVGKHYRLYNQMIYNNAGKGDDHAEFAYIPLIPTDSPYIKKILEIVNNYATQQLIANKTTKDIPDSLLPNYSSDFSLILKTDNIPKPSYLKQKIKDKGNNAQDTVSGIVMGKVSNLKPSERSLILSTFIMAFKDKYARENGDSDKVIRTKEYRTQLNVLVKNLKSRYVIKQMKNSKEPKNNLFYALNITIAIILLLIMIAYIYFTRSSK